MTVIEGHWGGRSECGCPTNSNCSDNIKTTRERQRKGGKAKRYKNRIGKALYHIPRHLRAVNGALQFQFVLCRKVSARSWFFPSFQQVFPER